MAEFSSEFEKQENQEFLEKLQYLKNFAAGFSAADFVVTNPKFAAVLGSMPFKLREYIEQISLIEGELEKEDNNQNLDPVKKEEERKKREEKIQKLAKEIFIISCASNKVLEQKKITEFLDKFDLAKKLNEVGENGLSPISATMISAKSPQEKDQTIAVLVVSGAKITEQDLEVAGRKKTNEQENSRQREKEKDEKKPVKKRLNFKAEIEAQQKLEADLKAQQQIINAGIALELHQETMLILRDQMRQKARELLKEQEKIDHSDLQQKKESEQQEGKIKTQEVENHKEKKIFETKNSELKVHEKKESEPKVYERKISDLEKILGVSLNEKTINQLLFSAVKNGQSALAMLLINYGADINKPVEQGKSSLEAAVISGNNFLISNFLERATPELKKQVFNTNPNLANLAENQVKGEENLGKESNKNSRVFETIFGKKLQDLVDKLPLPSPSKSVVVDKEKSAILPSTLASKTSNSRN